MRDLFDRALEPVPEPPTQEQLNAEELQQLLAYLASTDWYISRKMERAIDIPPDVATKRLAAIERINILKDTTL